MINRVHYHRNFTGSREGEFLIDTSVAYVSALEGQGSPSVAFDGTNYLVVWQDSRNGSYDIYGTRIKQDGVILDSAGFAVSSDPYNQKCPAIAFDGTNYLVVWEDYRNSNHADIYGTRISQEGVVLDADDIAISIDTSWRCSPSVGFNGIYYLVVWNDFRNGPSDIYGARIDQSGVVLDSLGFAISTDVWCLASPAITSDNTNYLVVWQDARSGSYDIYGARIDQSEVVLDTLGIPISVCPSDEQYPAVAFDGSNYLVVWSNGDIYGARVSQTGILLDTVGIAISTEPNSQSEPCISFDGVNYLIAWQDNRYSSLYTDIYGARVTPAGVVLDSDGIVISTEI